MGFVRDVEHEQSPDSSMRHKERSSGRPLPFTSTDLLHLRARKPSRWIVAAYSDRYPFVLVTLAIISVIGGVMVLAPLVLFLLFAGLAIRRSSFSERTTRSAVSRITRNTISFPRFSPES